MAKLPWNELDYFQKLATLASVWILTPPGVFLTKIIWKFKILGDRYKNAHPDSKPFNQNAFKGKQMMTSRNIKQTALQTGYFESKFNRILTGEAYIEPTQVKKQRRIERSRKMIGRKIWFPSDGQKG